MHIGATWRIRWNDLFCGGNTFCCHYHCINLFSFVITDAVTLTRLRRDKSFLFSVGNAYGKRFPRTDRACIREIDAFSPDAGTSALKSLTSTEIWVRPFPECSLRAAVVCNTIPSYKRVLAGAPRTVTNAATCVITDTQKFYRGLGSDTARPTALARRSRPGSLQACSDSSPMSERPRYTVSVGALHPGLQCWHAAASEFRQPSPTCRSLPRFRLNTYGRRTFSVAGPMASDCFRRLLKTYLFTR